MYTIKVVKKLAAYRLRCVLMSAVCASGVYAAQFSLDFSETQRNLYHPLNVSSITWNGTEGLLHLSTGVEKGILANYTSLHIVPASPSPGAGYEFLVIDDCFISGVRRYAPEGGNVTVRLWTDDLEEWRKAPYKATVYPWEYFDEACENISGWSSKALNMYYKLRPLTENNTYWLGYKWLWRYK